jgi:hypothetical protein
VIACSVISEFQLHQRSICYATETNWTHLSYCTKSDKRRLRWCRCQRIAHSLQEQQIDLEGFLAQLPELWKKGEARPTHQPKPTRTRDYRTHRDPFEGDWTTILEWLEKAPDATASSLLERLIERSPEKYESKQLRTLQRRVGQWRFIMAKQLVTGSTST